MHFDPFLAALGAVINQLMTATGYVLGFIIGVSRLTFKLVRWFCRATGLPHHETLYIFQ